MITAMNNTFVNALLADASYVDLTGTQAFDNLKARLTEPLATFITNNFEVLDQPGSTSFIGFNSGFSATVWRGKDGTDYAGQTFVSMRGTAQGVDFLDDAVLALTAR